MKPGDQIACSRELFLAGSGDSSGPPKSGPLGSIFSGHPCPKSAEPPSQCSSLAWQEELAAVIVEQAVLSVLVAVHLVSAAGRASLPPCSAVSCSYSRRASPPAAARVLPGLPGLEETLARSQHGAPGAPCPSARSATWHPGRRCRIALSFVLCRTALARHSPATRAASYPGLSLV